MNEFDHTEILVKVFGRTDVGRTREHNEDAFVVADLSTNDASLQPAVREHRVGNKGSLFMVADGMGGAAAGEIASQMAIEIVLRELRENWIPLQQPSAEAFARCLKRAAQVANQQIHSYATSHQEYRGMGTTATIAGLLADTLYLVQVGDSRGYLVRDGVAQQITKDQSLMQKLIEAGELTEEEAAQSERRNIILQALGPEPTIKVDLTFQRLRRGDILVLCSDGLSGQIVKDDISRIVGQERDLVQACRQLIDLANEAGGPDNITVIIARFDGSGLNVEAEGDAVGHRVFALNDPGQPLRYDQSQETTQPVPVIKSEPRNSIGRAEPSLTPSEGTPAAPPPSAPPTTWSADPDAATSPTLESIDAVAAGDATVNIPPTRKSRGIAIAIVLLALMIAFGTWYAIRTVRKVQPEAAEPTPTAPPAARP
jgi:serine/threonine protein phosphatase PrpC